MPRRRRRPHCLALAAAALALAAFAAPASAGLLVASATSCDAQPLSKPFAPWLDHADYTPLPGGSFEAGTPGWSLSGGAGTQSGNSPFRVAGSDHSRSLSLASGASAVSAPICVGLEHPTIRFFAKRRSGPLSTLSTLRVDVLVEDALGVIDALPIGAVPSAGSWQPTLPMAVVANLLPLLPGERTAVAFRFTAQGGDWSVDDVYVDPYRRH